MKNKAIALISGGLDSLLAARLIQAQGVEVVGIGFVMSLASTDVKGTKDKIIKAATKAGIRTKVMDVSEEFLDVLKNPRYGYGSNINPCIDCKIFMLKKAKQIMQEEKAEFIVTGEVLGERPMSQNRNSLDLIRERSSLSEILVRPLSAKLLDETMPEKQGMINREQLLSISGRSRKPQLALARELNITDFSAPGTSCLLTDPKFSGKIKDLMANKALTLDNVELMKKGRCFRLDENTIVVVARDEQDSERLAQIKQEEDLSFELKDQSGPYTVLRGEKNGDNIAKAASLTVFHSKQKTSGKVDVLAHSLKEERTLKAGALTEAETDKLRI